MNIKKYSYFILDIALIVISLASATLLRFDFVLPISYYQRLFTLIPIAIISTTFFSLFFGSYNNFLKYFGFSELFKQFSVSICVGMVFLIIKLSGLMHISGSITIIYCGIFFVLSSALRGAPRFNRFLMSLRAVKMGKSKKILIVGGGHFASEIIKQLLEDEKSGIYPIGILDDDPLKHGQKIAGVKILGSIEKASYFAHQLHAKQILIAIPSATDEQMSRIFDLVSNANIPTKIYQKVQKTSSTSFDNQVLKEITIEDLLFRAPVDSENELSQEFLKGKTILVTGGAGSIGRELCLQILENECKQLIIYDFNENGLSELNEDFHNKYSGKYHLCLGSVRDTDRLAEIFNKYKPNLVFHAAAHKHVPMMEINPFEAVKNNIVGTLNVVKQTIACECEKFILISTDKAVNPTNVMGATKRICELIMKSYSNDITDMVAVRFGNVLGSNGSVVPLFKKQIEQGGPVTVTHKDMTRYFMTIKEAVSLVLLAGSLAKNSELYVLDMGQPVKIYELAITLIRLSGFKPFQDINIEITGLREGEKLFEELNLDSEIVDQTLHKKIFVMRDNGVDKSSFCEKLNTILALAKTEENAQELRRLLFDIIKEDVKEEYVIQ